MTRSPVWTRQGPLWVPDEWHRALTQRRRDIPLSAAVRAALDVYAYLWVPQKGVLQVQHNTGTVGATSPGTSVTTGGAASTKGTPAQLISSTSFETYWVQVIFHSYAAAATDSQGMVDLLVGAATEEVLIPNLIMGFCGSMSSAVSAGPIGYGFPLYIPAGTRVAAQAAGQRISTAMRVVVYLYGGDAVPAFRIGREVVTYGVGTVPFGTTIVPGASAAEGAWTQITASTSEDHFAVLPGFQAGTDTTLNNLTFAVDIGLDSATEQERAQSYWFGTNTNEAMFGPVPATPAFFDIPSGTRMVMRASCNGVLDVGNYNGCLYAVS